MKLKFSIAASFLMLVATANSLLRIHKILNA